MHSRILAGVVGALALGMAGLASAAPKWANSTGGASSFEQGAEYSVADFGLFLNPNDTTQVVLQLKLKQGQLVSGTGCTLSNNSAPDGAAYFANWGTTTSAFMQKAMDILNTAAVAGGTIKVQYSDGNCSNTLGAFLQGLRYIPPAN